jgi:transposase
MSTARKGYPSDVSDDKWAFVAPYLTLQSEQALQRQYALREGYHGLRWLVRSGAQWRMLPHDVPPLGSGLPADPALAAGRLL